MGGGVFPFVFPYLNHLKWWFPSRDVGETVKSCRIHSSVTPGFLVAVHFANVQRPAASDIQNVCIYNMCKPCYLLITSFQVTFNPSYFCRNSYFFRFFSQVSLSSPCCLNLQLLHKCPPKTRPLHEIAPTVGKGSFQRVDCNFQVDI